MFSHNYKQIIKYNKSRLISQKNATASSVDEVRRFCERQDEPLIDLLLSDKEKIEGHIDGNIHCPLCQNDTLEITETAEGDSERVYFQIKCSVCGCEFIIVEDLVNACQRGIENAKNDIEYSKNKIEYFKTKLEGK